MNLGKATVMIASAGVAMTIINQLNSMLTVTQFANIGTRIPEGLALGIQQGKSQVIYAVTEATGAAIRQQMKNLKYIRRLMCLGAWGITRWTLTDWE